MKQCNDSHVFQKPSIYRCSTIVCSSLFSLHGTKHVFNEQQLWFDISNHIIALKERKQWHTVLSYLKKRDRDSTIKIREKKGIVALYILSFIALFAAKVIQYPEIQRQPYVLCTCKNFTSQSYKMKQSGQISKSKY